MHSQTKNSWQKVYLLKYNLDKSSWVGEGYFQFQLYRKKINDVLGTQREFKALEQHTDTRLPEPKGTEMKYLKGQKYLNDNLDELLKILDIEIKTWWWDSLVSKGAYMVT